MKTIKTITVFYCIYTVYTLYILSVSNYPILTAFAGLLFIWIGYVLYVAGYFSINNKHISEKADRYSKHESSYPFSKIDSYNKLKLLLLNIVTWLFSILSTKYYTGKTFNMVIHGLGSNESAYYSYQSYFLNNILASFSFAKIPYILMLGFTTIIMMWSILVFVGWSIKNKWFQWLFLISSVMAYLYFGIARGTNFETYIVFIIISFCLLQKSNTANLQNKGFYYFVFLLLGIIMVLVFRLVVSLRGVTFQNNICPEIHYDSERFVSQYFPTITGIGISVFGYLGYGIYTIGVSFVDIILESTNILLGSLFPKGNLIINGSSLESVLRSTIDLGVKWCPDYIKLIDLLGFPLFLMMLFLLGRISKIIQDSYYPLLLKDSILLIIFIQMISIPVGNFLMTSSANQIMVIYVLGWLLKSNIPRVKFKL